MKRSLYLLACTALLVACAKPVIKSQRTEAVAGNSLQITSGTLAKGRFVLIENAKKGWEGQLKGGKQKWGVRRNFLHGYARKEIETICGTWFVAINKGPLFNMLDNDETMGGLAPALGVSVAMVAYLAAEAATLDTNVPVSAYIEFTCPNEEK